MVGDTNSGKSFFSHTILAEATINAKFNQHRLIYDDVEDGALMDTKRYFGHQLARRLEILNSSTIEEFYFNVDDALNSKQPFIYILDSMDGLSSGPELDKFKERKAAHRKQREVSGSYGDGKAKRNSSDLRQVRNRLKESGSILLIINQTRDNINKFTSMFKPQSRSGGHALEFYAAAQLWTSVKKRIKTPSKVKGKYRQTGILSQIKVKRSRFTGRECTVQVPIYWSTGLDDVGSMIAWLIEEGHWNGSEKKMTAPEFNHNGSVDELIRAIENQGQEKALRLLVSEHWADIEAACTISRKAKYQ